MKRNPQTQKIVLVDRTERDADEHGAFLKVYELGGEIHRIKEKRMGLWQVFESARHGEPILATFETYRGFEYIVAAHPITDDILKQAIMHLGEKATDPQREERNRSTALSYAKDLTIGNKISIDKLFEQAEKNYRFIKGQE